VSGYAKSLEKCKDRYLAAKNAKVGNTGVPGTLIDSDGSITYRTEDEKKAGIKRARQNGRDTERRWKKLKRNQPFYCAPLELKELAVGSIGTLRTNDAWVLQVVGKNEMLVREEWVIDIWTARNNRPVMKHRDVEKVFWLKGVSTEGVVDKSRLEYDKPLQITGTKTYDTAVGTSTVFVLEPIDLAPYLPAKD